MITIPIHNVHTCSAAIDWCNKNLLVGTWNLSTRWPGVGFNFSFKRKEDAAFFSLKWLNT